MDSYMEYQLRSKGLPSSLPLFRSRSRKEGEPWERGCKDHLHIIKTAQLPFGPSFIPLQMFIQNLELTETSIIWRWNFDSRRGVVSKGHAKYMHTRETRSPPTLARSLSQLANYKYLGLRWVSNFGERQYYLRKRETWRKRNARGAPKRRNLVALIASRVLWMSACVCPFLNLSRRLETIYFEGFPLNENNIKCLYHIFDYPRSVPVPTRELKPGRIGWKEK